MDNNDVKQLVEAFQAYRELMEPIRQNLQSFTESYDGMRADIESLNGALGGDMKERFDSIYRTLAGQAEKAADLSSRIDQFTRLTNRYTAEVTKLLDLFEKTESRILSVNELEARAEAQIGRLDKLVEEKAKTYNIKDLQRTLDGYNNNVQKVSEFINRDVAESLSQSQRKLDSIRTGMDEVIRVRKGEDTGLEKLLETHLATNAFLQKLVEKDDVNEAYLFEVLDKWAETRKVKTKK